ncbi:PAS domain S-box protein [Caenispirillum salinarum]|uniref:PAS domain S-box protein n=1 Tax=Caenispirillum salinarum TaxID=859058 RepID=UPI00384B5EB5
MPTTALDSLGAGIAVYGPDDRLVHATPRLKAMFPQLAGVMLPGARFADLAAQAARSGLFHGVPDRVAADRISLVDRAPAAEEVPLTDGRWVLLEVSRIEGGGHTVSYTDITAFRRRQQDLEAREDRLALAMKASREGIWDWDVEAGSLYFSPRWKEILGYAENEIENSWATWRALAHPDDRPAVEARTRAAMEPPEDGGAPGDGGDGGDDGYEVEFRMRHRDGTWRRIRSRIHISRGADGRARRLVGTHADVTDLRAAQERQAWSASRLAEAERIASLGSWERDAQGREEWSPGFRALLGVPEDTPPSREILQQVVHPEDRARLDSCVDRGGCAMRIIRPDGAVREIACSVKQETDAEGAVVRTIGAWLDVSLLRAVENRAARAEVHLLGAVETVADGVILLDPDMRVVLVNSRYIDGFPGLEAYLQPGESFLDFLNVLKTHGMVRRFDGMHGDDDWLTPRLGTLGARQEPFEMELSDGRWFLIKETRTVDDYILIVRTDITALKRREAELLESQARFQAMFDNSVQFIGLLARDGRLLKVNRTALRFIDHEEADLIGRPFWQTPWWTHDPAAQKRLRDALKTAAAGRADRFEATHEDAAGTEHVVDVSITPVFGPGGHITHLIAEGRDLTAQREAEVALRRNARFVQALGDTAQTPIYAHDSAGRYVFCNDAFALAVARPQTEIIGKSLFHVAMREHGVNMQEINSDLLQAGGSLTYEARVTMPDGSARDMIVTKSTYSGDSAGPEGIVTVLTDISRQKEVERRFSDFARSSADWFWEMDKQGRFTYVSDRIAEATALRASDLVGKRREDIVDTTWNPEAVRSYWDALENRRPVRDFTYRTVPIDGRVHYIRITAVPAHDVNGNFIGFRGTGSEVTAEAEAAAALHAAKEAAEIASRSKTEFLAAMSHELRTPLNAIIGFSEIMQMQALGPLGSETYLDYARDIRASGEHLLTMVNDVLDASRLEIGKLELHEEEVDLLRLADAAVHLISQRAADSGVALHAEVPDGLPLLYADGGRLKKVLTSLLSNGVKFTPEGGSVTLAMRMTGDGCLEMTVRDTGIGMSDEQVGQALQPFTQLDAALSRRYEGIGLGLTLAKDLVELHGGSLGVKGVTGEGTTVTVVLPADRVRPRA